jgi:hypothetical protein
MFAKKEVALDALTDRPLRCRDLTCASGSGSRLER